MDRSWLEIDLNNVRHNAAALSSLLPAGARLMAVVKADAYGHGAVPVARCLEKAGVVDFAVATVDEGIQLRRGWVVCSSRAVKYPSSVPYAWINCWWMWAGCPMGSRATWLP